MERNNKYMLETNYNYLLFLLAMKPVLQSPTVPIQAGESKILDKLTYLNTIV